MSRDLAVRDSAAGDASARAPGHRKLLHIGRRVAPVLISIGLIAWLVWSIGAQKLLRAMSSTAWPWLLLATLVQLVALFAWDTVCMWWLFSRPARRLPFWTFLRVRTDAVLWSAVNLEIGQAVFAYNLAKKLGMPVSEALGRCFLLALFDFGTLQSLALVTSFLEPNPYIAYLRWICVASVAGLVVLVVGLHFLPTSWRQWLESKTWANWLAWWSWRDSVRLWAMRLVLFLLVILYAGIGLLICRIPVDVLTVLNVIPFVMIAESLPGTGGLGERETALVYLLSPDSSRERAMLLTFGLTWSTVVILGRVVIGLVSRSLPRTDEQTDAKDSEHAGKAEPVR